MGFDWGGAGSGAASGAATGATIGSIVPGIGTGIDAGIDKEEDTKRALLALSDELKKIINNGIVPTDNHDSVIYDVSDTGNANTEFSFSHGLGRIPVYYRIIKQDKAGSVYTSTAHTIDTAYFKTDGANVALTLELW